MKSCVVNFQEKYDEALASDANIPYKIRQWRIQSDHMQFLDMVVSHEGERLIFAPVVKPASLGVPLTCDSMHPAPVFSSWPRVVIYRYAQGSSHVATFNECICNLLKRLRNLLILHLSSSDWKSSILCKQFGMVQAR